MSVDNYKNFTASLLRSLREAGAGPVEPDEVREGFAPAHDEVLNEGGESVEAAFNMGDVDDGNDFDAFGDQGGGLGLTAARDRTEGADEVGRDPEKLLDRLFDKGVLPRYAFPTDVVTFHVFDKEKSQDARRPVMRYSPQQGLNQALSGYAPGREVWVDGKKHYSFAIWSPFKRNDCWKAWLKRKLYFECERCGYAKLEERREPNYLGRVCDCPACGAVAAFGPALLWLRPAGFAHPVDQSAELPSGETPPATRPTRAKLSAPFTEAEPLYLGGKSRWRAGYEIWAEKQELLLTNTGSQDRRKPGFLHCPKCGRTEPNGWEQGQLSGAHRVPFPVPDAELRDCSETPVWLVLGNTFRTDVALIRFQLGEAVTLLPGSTVAKICLTTAAEALVASAARMLEIEPADIGAGFRVAMTPEGRAGKQAELYLYDLTPGGAGFVREAMKSHEELMLGAIQSLNRCSCTHSCYECLRSYKNQLDHKHLNRHLGKALLEHCLEGVTPENSEAEETRNLMALCADLAEQGKEVELVSGGIRLNLPPGERVIALGHPLNPSAPGSARARALISGKNAVIVDLLKVDLALPVAVREALGTLTSSANSRPAPKLPEEEGGCPVYELDQIKAGDVPAPSKRYAISGAPEGAFIAQLTRPTLEQDRSRKFFVNSWVVFTPAAEGDFIEQGNDKIPRLLARREGAFNATKESWTLGLPKLMQKEGRVRITYLSKIAPRSEVTLASEVKILGKVYGVIESGELIRLGG
jgi:hypothetical protein